MALVCLVIFADDVSQDYAYAQLEALYDDAYYIEITEIRQDDGAPLIEDVVVAVKKNLTTLIEEHAASPQDAKCAEHALYNPTE